LGADATASPDINVNLLANFPHLACSASHSSVMSLLNASSQGDNKARASRTFARLSGAGQPYVINDQQATAWVKAGRPLLAAIQQLRALLPAGSTVLHWGGSDDTFLDEAKQFADLEIIDLRKLFIDDCGGLYPKVGRLSIPFGLGDLHKAYGLPEFEAHVASADAKATLEVAVQLWLSVKQQAVPSSSSSSILSSQRHVSLS